MHRLRALLLPGLAVATLAAGAPTLAQGVAMPPHPDINTTGFSGDADTLSNAVKTIEAASGGPALLAGDVQTSVRSDCYAVWTKAVVRSIDRSGFMSVAIGFM